ncbi:leukocyte cysteine proteinase inhibitor 1-like [Apostichopus japonicus]|uniref:leukocyte cysteine proteinase inhibitor 1-like n=1 Tax=Stichopus japonicus TaxID=307972 RepID=UPI003AB675C1
MSEQRDGGWSDTKPTGPEQQALADKVKGDVEKAANRIFSEYKAVLYRFQVVQGMNYIIKVHVEAPTYVHVKLFQDLNGGVKYEGFQDHKTEEDPIIIF